MAELKYVSAIDAKIYINGILIDDIYDLQYAYRESKEPIYGYNSKHFDNIVPGNVIVHGSFSINYKHDAFLYSLLAKSKNDMSTKTGAQNNIKVAGKYNSEYKELLYKYRSMNEKIRTAETDMLQATAYKQAQERISSANTDVQNKNLDIKKDACLLALRDYEIAKDNLTTEEISVYEDFQVVTSSLGNTEGLDAGDIKAVNDYLDELASDYPKVKEAFDAESRLRAAESDYEAQKETWNSEISANTSTLTSQTEKEKLAQKSLSDLKAKKLDLIKKLQEKKNQIHSVSADWDSLATDDALTSKKKQPEDMNKFNIFIRFNNMNHIILEDCYITSHSFGTSIQEGSSACKQYFTFLGKSAS